MSKINKEVAQAIAEKLLVEKEKFEIIPEENYKGNFVFFIPLKMAKANTNYGLPIFVLVSPEGEAWYATYEETQDIMAHTRSKEEVEKEEDDEEEDEGYIELPPM